jgi:hypothetical protein
MSRIGCRRKSRIVKVRGIVRQGTRAVVSIGSMAVGVAALGFGIAGIAVAIANMSTGGVEEGDRRLDGRLPRSCAARVSCTGLDSGLSSWQVL